MDDFPDLGTTAATARMEGDTDKRTPSSHLALRTEHNACLKPWKLLSFGGVDVDDFPDLGMTAATARMETRTNQHHLRTRHCKANSMHA